MATSPSLPTGCLPTDFLGPDTPSNVSKHHIFSGTCKIDNELCLLTIGGDPPVGCVTGVASVLDTCCAQVNSTAGVVNGTCGCPLPNHMTLALVDGVYGRCSIANNATSYCGVWDNAARASHVPGSVRWNPAVVIFGVVVIKGVMGM